MPLLCGDFLISIKVYLPQELGHPLFQGLGALAGLRRGTVSRHSWLHNWLQSWLQSWLHCWLHCWLRSRAVRAQCARFRVRPCWVRGARGVGMSRPWPLRTADERTKAQGVVARSKPLDRIDTSSTDLKPFPRWR
jgi:hypothetical protein